MSDVIGPPFSARSKVHEYGGGQFAASDGRVCFVNDEDQDLYLAGAAAPVRITKTPDTRFADLAFDPAHPRLYSVTERHRPSAPPQNAIAAVGLEGESQGRTEMLLAGRDFYASPRPSPDGSRLAWLAWDLPAMPWEAAELWVGQIAENGAIIEAVRIAGGPEGGAFQPEWAEDGALYFAAPNGDWGNLHVWRDGVVQPVARLEAEFARPLWSLGMSSYAVLESGRLIAACWRDGRSEFGIADEKTGTWTPLTSGFTRIDDLTAGPEFVAINGSDDEAPGRVHLIARDASAFQPASQEETPVLAAGDVSHARILAFQSGESEAWVLFYPPASERFAGPNGSLPPLIVSAHGGPTGMARRGFALDRQYWTTRGFAFLDVDYRGSSGYGLTFQRAL
ncbi:MAG: S9 family peptidase, partial [Rhizobiales bacterium]|nr:S9 family peptidase [Hyphomicrobiales bacterium]